MESLTWVKMHTRNRDLHSTVNERVVARVTRHNTKKERHFGTLIFIDF
jgi:hypothetical protein